MTRRRRKQDELVSKVFNVLFIKRAVSLEEGRPTNVFLDIIEVEVVFIRLVLAELA
jgi:hypothetical protein